MDQTPTKNLELWSHFEWKLSYSQMSAFVQQHTCISQMFSLVKNRCQFKLMKNREENCVELSMRLYNFNESLVTTTYCLRFFLGDEYIWSTSKSETIEEGINVPIGRIMKRDFSYDTLEGFEKIVLTGEFKVSDEKQEKWNEYLFDLIKDPCVDLSKDYGHLLEKEFLSDFSIQVGDVQFSVHKSILAARSSVFASMFESDMKENRENVTKIEEFSPEIVDAMINYIYMGHSAILETEPLELYKAADKYDLHGLKIKCEKILCNTISVDNVVDILKFANLYNVKELQSRSSSFIKNNMHKVVDTPAFLKLFGSNASVMEIFDCFKS